MSNDTNIFERLYRLQASINKMVLDGARDPNDVTRVLQDIIDMQAPPKFAPMLDIHGQPLEFIVVVPEDYEHSTALARFKATEEDNCYCFSQLFTDANFNNTSRVLKPGDRLLARAFGQIIEGTTTTKERVDFLQAQPENTFIGAQGIPFILNERARLPKGTWYSLFDEKKYHLPYIEGHYKLPEVSAIEEGCFDVYLCNFERKWDQDNAFFGFSDI